MTNSNLISELKRITKTNNKGYYEYNGKEYKKIVATPHESQNKFKYVSEYYFLVEPITWNIIEDKNEGTFTLMSDKILFSQKFNLKDYEGSDFKTSFIIEWLNNTLIYDMFNYDERLKLVKNIEFDKNVYFESIWTIKNSLWRKRFNPQASPTDYAIASGLVYYQNKPLWWTSSKSEGNY